MPLLERESEREREREREKRERAREKGGGYLRLANLIEEVGGDRGSGVSVWHPEDHARVSLNDIVHLVHVHLVANGNDIQGRVRLVPECARTPRSLVAADVASAVGHQHDDVVDGAAVAVTGSEHHVAGDAQRLLGVGAAAALVEGDGVEHVALLRVLVQVEGDLRVGVVGQHADPGAAELEGQAVDRLAQQGDDGVVRLVDAAGEIQQEDDVSLAAALCSDTKRMVLETLMHKCDARRRNLMKRFVLS